GNLGSRQTDRWTARLCRTKARHLDLPSGATHLAEPDRQRELAVEQGHRAQRPLGPEGGLRSLSRARTAGEQLGGQLERRSAANAGDRPRVDGQPQPPVSRRALGGTFSLTY